MSTLAIDSRLKLQLFLWYAVIALALLILGVFLVTNQFFTAFLVAGLLALVTLPYHAKLASRLAVATFSSAIMAPFVPGYTPLWMVATLLGWSGVAVVTMLRRQSPSYVETVRRNKWIFIGGACFCVVLVMLMKSQGVGFSRLMGASKSGARQYVENIACFIFPILFAMIDMEEKTLFRLIMLRYLLSFTFVISDLAVSTGKFQWVLYLLRPPVDAYNFSERALSFGVERYQSLMDLGTGAVFLLLLYHPLRSFLSWRAFWLVPVTVFSLVLGAFSGHRSFYVYVAFNVFFVAVAQRFLTLRNRLIALGGLASLLVFLYAFADSLPLSAQRAVSFLPGIQVDRAAVMDASATALTRKQLFFIGLRMIPDHLWIGRGFPRWENTITAAELPDLATVNLLVAEGAFASGPIGLLVDTGLPGCVSIMLLLWGGSVAAWRIVRMLRRHGYEDRFALACALVAANWFANLPNFFFIQGNANMALITFGLPCGLLILCERILRQRVQRLAQEELTVGAAA